MAKAKKAKEVIEEVVEEITETVEVKQETPEATEEVTESKFKCDNCEDSGMACYKCNKNK